MKHIIYQGAEMDHADFEHLAYALKTMDHAKIDRIKQEKVTFIAGF